MIRSFAFLGKGEVYLRGEPVILQDWPEGDSQPEEGMSGLYYCPPKHADSAVRLQTINSLGGRNRYAFFFVERQFTVQRSAEWEG